MSVFDPTNPPRPRVLLVEDDDHVAYVMQHALTDAYEVVRVAAILHAKTMLKTNSFDAIVLDWRLGAERGRELLEHLPHADGRAVPPTVVASGDTSEQEALKYGATLVIHKPFNLKELAEAVEQALRRTS